jgi:superoxide dismutase, Cu-Zn family
MVGLNGNLINTNNFKTNDNFQIKNNFVNEEKIIKAIAYFNTDIKGTVFFEEIYYDNNYNVKVKVNLTGFEPNSTHGFHVHESGDLTSGCDSLCAHFNPYNKTHGGRNDLIRHVGDLGNLVADSEGKVELEFVDHLIKLRGEEANIIGRGLIVHADVDDCGKSNHHTSKTTCNSGKRIACAIIGYTSICN